ncbi:group III truncated hemoglobin [Aquimarina aquimarini]|uniref:group III truncated hemoglobin n=1 Tax=Aquimarina aquimarini TaxID=1191734 RepID=UPI000D559BAE|nr:group III truncated hemoglobin [Aquimarina aquimarini]
MKTTIKNDIQNRNDIKTLVTQFYIKVRNEESLGPIFNHMISNWDTHIEKLIDFWETNLLFTIKYKGNPIKVHQIVDRVFNGTINQNHFGIWLNLWIETLDTLFYGEKAETAKRRARKMSTHLYIKMYESRVTQKITCPFLNEKDKI